MINNYYMILKVSYTASSKEIKSAYKKLVKKWHPDINKSSEAVVKFKEINKAYKVLINTESRFKYDEAEKLKTISYSNITIPYFKIAREVERRINRKGNIFGYVKISNVGKIVQNELNKLVNEAKYKRKCACISLNLMISNIDKKYYLAKDLFEDLASQYFLYDEISSSDFNYYNKSIFYNIYTDNSDSLKCLNTILQQVKGVYDIGWKCKVIKDSIER